MPLQLSTPDKIALHIHQWPIETPQAAVLMVHGFGEHAGRYAHVAAALNAAGYHAEGIDQRGHGESGGPRAHVDSYEQWVDDLQLVWQDFSARYAHLPLYLVAHSMGSMVTLNFLLKYRPKVQAVVVSGAALLLPLPAPLMSFISRLATLAPQLAATPVDNKFLSHDAQVVAAYAADPLVYHGRVSLHQLRMLYLGGQNVLKNAAQIQHPLLILHGAADKIIPAKASRQLHERVGSSDKKLHVYPDLYHEIFNENPPMQAQIIGEAVAWLKAHP